MPAASRSNLKRSLAEADPNAEIAPLKTSRAGAGKKHKENTAPDDEQSKENRDGCGKEGLSNELVTQPIAKPKPSAKAKGKKAGGSKESPMLTAKSGPDARNVREEAKEKEKAEKKEAQEKEKAKKKEEKEKEKAEKKEAKEKEMAMEKETGRGEPNTKEINNGKKTGNGKGKTSTGTDGIEIGNELVR